MESKHQKFVRLAEGRTNRIIDSVRSLAKLANKNHYDYSNDEVHKIFAALKNEIDEAKSTYTAALSRDEKNKFKLLLRKEK